MKRLLLSLLLIAVGAGCTSPATIFRWREKLKMHSENAQRYYGAGRYDGAVQQAKKALEYDSEDSKALTILGYCYLQVARRVSDRETKLKYFEMTEAEFERAIQGGSERDPAVFKSYFGLGLVYFMWSREVKWMIEESSGKKPPLVVSGSTGESEGDIWSE